MAPPCSSSSAEAETKGYKLGVIAGGNLRVLGSIIPKGEPMKMFLLAALLATSGAAFAQQGAQERHLDCSKAKDPKACEERVAKMKATHAQAEKACEGKQGAERRECMVKSMCAQQKDPKACEERVAKAKGMHRDARAACEGKTGAEHQDCMVKQMCAESKDAAKRDAMRKERLSRREKLREACKDKRGEELKACIREHRSPKRTRNRRTGCSARARRP